MLPFLGIGMRIDLCQSCGHCWVFQICGHNECKTLMASSFRDLNSPAGISWHPLALLAAVLLKACLTSHSGMSGSGCLTTPLWSSSSLRRFCTALPCILSISSWFLQHLLGLCHFYSLFAHLWAESSLEVSSFPEEISRLSPFLVFFCYSTVFVEEGLLVSSSCSLKLCAFTGCAFRPLPCFSLLFVLLQFIKSPQITTLPFCSSFPLGLFCLLPRVQYYGPRSIVLQTHCYLDLVPWICLLPLQIHMGFDLSHT